MIGERPPFVIVSGAPGAGKTTLATTLSEALRLPLIVRDELKERLADVLLADQLGAVVSPDRASQALGRASYEMLFLVTDQLLRAGTGVIVESNFRRGISEVELAPRVAIARSILVHCAASDALIVARYRARNQRGERHRVHRDDDRLGGLRDELTAGRFEPLALEVPTIRVDTTDGYVPGPEAIVAQIRSSTGQSA